MKPKDLTSLKQECRVQRKNSLPFSRIEVLINFTNFKEKTNALLLSHLTFLITVNYIKNQ